MKHLPIILLLWNITTFLMMGTDKFQAVRGGRRISERTLLTAAFLMGAAGSCAGALVFHHKTRKNKFRALLPIALIFNFTVIYLAFMRGQLC